MMETWAISRGGARLQDGNTARAKLHPDLEMSKGCPQLGRRLAFERKTHIEGAHRAHLTPSLRLLLSRARAPGQSLASRCSHSRRCCCNGQD